MNSGKIILTTLNKLRFSNLTIDAFWTGFVKASCDLCHAPMAALLLDNGSGDWSLREGYAANTSALSSSMEALFFKSGVSLAARAFQNGFAFEPVSIDKSIANVIKPVVLAVRLYVGDVEQKALLLMLMDRQSSMPLNEYIIRSQLIADVPASYFSRQDQSVSSPVNEDYLIDAMKILTMMLHQKHFVLACMSLVNDLASRFLCTQVSIGWKKDYYVSTVAISHVEKIEKSTDAVQKLEAVFEEAFDQDQEILWPCQHSHGGLIVDTHAKYAYEKQNSEMLSLPLRLNDCAVAVITCEKHEGGFSEQQVMMLRLATNQITPLLSDLYHRDRWFGGRMALKAKEALSWWLGSEYTWVKLMAIVCSVFMLYILFFNWQYKIDAVASLATDDLRYLSVPFNGYVHDVKAHAGDWVKQGDVVLRMDKEELYLKESEAIADVRRFTSETQKSRAAKSFADMRVAEARAQQANAQLSRIRYYLKRSDVVAPFDGVVAQGDKKQLLGAPVSKGDLLFKIAQLKNMYVTMRIRERDIEDVSVGDHAELMLLSKPDEHISIVIERIVPMAEVESKKGNVFIAKARLDKGAKLWWRPGMSGEVKIFVGERPIVWILTHKTIDFLRMYFWW